MLPDAIFFDGEGQIAQKHRLGLVVDHFSGLIVSHGDIDSKHVRFKLRPIQQTTLDSGVSVLKNINK